MKGRTKAPVMRIGLAILLAAAAGTNANAKGSPLCEVDIVQPELGDALAALARSCGVSLLYPSGLARTRGINPVQGRYSVPEALSMLLRGTSLTGELTAGGVITISPSASEGKRTMTKSPRTNALARASAAVIAMLGTGQVRAQTAEATAPQVAATSAEEILVTARKREERLFEVPLAISTFGQDSLDALGVNTIAELSKFTPGFEFQDVGQGGMGGRASPNVRFRGVAVQNENPASRSGAIFWDGAYISSGAGLIPLFDMKRVEVIKGPQNAFYGRNTFAGAVNFIPNDEWETLNGRLNAGYSASQDDSYKINGAVGFPITENLGVRLGASYERVGADYQFQNGDPLGQEDTYSVNGSLTWNVTPDFTIKANGFYVYGEDTRILQSQDFTAAPGQCKQTFTGQQKAIATGALSAPFTTDLSLSTLGLFCGEIPDWNKSKVNFSPVGDLSGTFKRAAASGTIGFARTLPPELQRYNFPEAPTGFGNTYKVWRANLNATYDLPAGYTATVQLSSGVSADYSIHDQQYGQSADNSVILTGFMNWSQDRSVEARIASPGDVRLRHQFGVNYYTNKFRGSTIPAFAGFGGIFDDHSLTFIDGENIGIFGSLDYDLLDNLTISAEGRWNKDTQTIVYSGPTLRDNPTPGVSNVSQSFNKFMPRVLVSYQPTDNINLYASWALSFLQGNQTNALAYSIAVPGAGINPTTVGFFTPVQKLNAFEAGIKAQVSSQLFAALSVYHMVWDNQVQFELSPNSSALFTPGDSKYTGVDFELNANPTPWLNLTGYVSWVDARFTDFGGSGSIAARVLRPGLPGGQQISSNGKRPRFISEWRGATSATIELGTLFNWSRRAFIRGDANYQGQFFIDNFEFNTVDGYWKANARAGVDITDKLTLEVYGNNLTNDQSWITAGGETPGDTPKFGFANRKTLGLLPPLREFGMEIRLKF